METNLKVNSTEIYPELTIELLQGLDRKIARGKTTPSDCELIDHYLSSAGMPGYLQKTLLEYGILSFNDIRDALIQEPSGVDFVPLEITFALLGCVRGLATILAKGEKIY